jgi:hypothetical protein
MGIILVAFHLSCLGSWSNGSRGGTCKEVVGEGHERKDPVSQLAASLLVRVCR